VVLLMTVAAGCAAVLVACGGGSAQPAQTSGERVAPSESSSTGSRPAAVISDRSGPSWKGRLGQTVQIDWYDQTTGEPVSEQVAVLTVMRFPNPDDDEGPDEFGDAYGPYEWKYGIRVRLTSLGKRAARYPTAHQFLQLSDGRDREDGVSGLGEPGGPDPSQPGESSTGWLNQYTERGFTPTEVVLPVGASRATWPLGSAAQGD
jgi:hypothetical protein